MKNLELDKDTEDDMKFEAIYPFADAVAPVESFSASSTVSFTADAVESTIECIPPEDQEAVPFMIPLPMSCAVHAAEEFSDVVTGPALVDVVMYG